MSKMLKTVKRRLGAAAAILIATAIILAIVGTAGTILAIVTGIAAIALILALIGALTGRAEITTLRR